MRVDVEGKDIPKFKEPLIRDGLRTVKGKDVGAKKSNRKEGYP